MAANTQGLDADSLKNLLTKTDENTTRILLLSQLCNELARYDPDSAIRLAQDGLKLAKQIDYRKGEVSLALSLGIALSNVGDYFNSIKWLSSNLKYIDTTQDRGITGRYYTELSLAYSHQGDYGEALKYSDKNIGPMEKWLERLPSVSCTICRGLFLTRAIIYWEKDQLDSAKRWIDKAFSYPPTPFPAINASAFDYAGRIQAKFKNRDSALQLYRQSILIFQEIKHPYKGLVNVYNSMAILLDTIGRRDSAIVYLHKSLTISQSKHFAREVLEANQLLANIYETYNTDSAYYYYKQAVSTRDILYNQDKQRQLSNYKFNLELDQQQAANAEAQLRSRVKIYALLGLMIVLVILGGILWRNHTRRKRAYILLRKQKAETDYQKEKAEQALEELKATQAQLVQQEKMASLGELTAGIAHEIQNPLNFVNNFSEVSNELIEEMKTELATGNGQSAAQIAEDIKQNLEKILHHGKRADAIVKGMLQHSRASSGKKESTDINALADEYLRLAYHGFRAKDKSFNAKFESDLDKSIGKVNVVPQDIGRVLLNLINNAFYAVTEKRQQLDGSYEPCVLVSTKKVEGKVEVKVTDNGNGIPQKVMSKIFQPFFTTKPTGVGTGLGLSLSYDIITKGHGGELKVNTVENSGSEFIITLPC